MTDNFDKFIYLMKPTDKGWFFKAQFDAQFKGDIEEVKKLMSIVTVHTVKDGRNQFRWCDILQNIEGYLIDGDEVYKKFLSRIENKPLCYGN